MSVPLIKIDQVVDVPAVEQFVRQSLADGIADGSFPDRQIGGGEAVLVARNGADIIGFATFYRPDGSDRIWLDLLWVRKLSRGQGIGRQLVEAVGAEAAAIGLPVEFGTLLRNERMQALAARCGYVIKTQALVYRKEIAA